MLPCGEVKSSVTDLVNLFATYRVVNLRNDEVVQGLLLPGVDPEHPTVRDALRRWPGMHFLHQTAGGTELTLVRRVAPTPRERWWLHLLLFLVTGLTTTISGAILMGREPLRIGAVPVGGMEIGVPVGIVAGELFPGLIFSVALLGILLVHEMGHYVVARRHGMDVSPPFFLPAPPGIFLIGTFGALIRLRSAMLNRAMLLDVGAGGPVASFLLSIPVAAAGLLLSRTVPALDGGESTQFVISYAGQPIWLGGSLLWRALAALTVGDAGGAMIVLHPLAFAGWLGLFVTALNLFPLAQLDGGHILYGLAGRWQRQAGFVFLGLLLVLGTEWWGWWFWAVLILLIGRGSIRHPAVFDPEFPVGGKRRWVGWLCVAIFLLTFVPVPFRI